MKLLQIAEDKGNEYATEVYEPRKTLFELLEEFRSVTLNLAQVLVMLPALRPRFYSISSSSLRSRHLGSAARNKTESYAFDNRGYDRETSGGASSSWTKTRFAYGPLTPDIES